MEENSHTTVIESHDVEESVMESEGGPVTSYKRCRKNTRHTQFVAISDFGVDKVDTVPAGLTKEDVVDYVLTWAALVVRILVKFVSNGRPHANYLFSDLRGQRVVNRGSGWVDKVFGPEEGLCRCAACQDKGVAKKFWKIWVKTARHVVFDTDEARQCEAILFNDIDSPNGSGIQRLVGWEVDYPNTDWDMSTLLCYTCDRGLIRRLHGLCEGRDEAEERVRRRVEESCEGVDDSVKQKVAELGQQKRDIQDIVNQREKEVTDLRNKVHVCIGKRLEELNVWVRDEQIEVDSVTKQALISFSPVSDRFDEINCSVRQTLENLSDRLDEKHSTGSVRQTVENPSNSPTEMEDLTEEKQTLRQLWASHDKIKVRKKEIWNEWNKQKAEVHNRVRDILSDWQPPSSRPVYVISHPHGCMKYVTIGHV